MTYRLQLASIIASALCALCVGMAHAQECSDDSDCGEGSECIKAASVGGCRPGADCDASVVEAETGECSRVRMTCEDDSDCADGLRCRVHGDATGACSRLPDGGMMCETTSSTSEGECEYEPEECEQTAECADGYLCTVLGESEACSGGGSACISPPGADAGCGAEEPEPTTCMTIERKYCFPPRVDCEADGDCKKGLRCVHLPDEFQEDATGDWKGAVRVCMPEGIALAIEGAVDSGGISASDSKSQNNSLGSDNSGSGPGEDDGEQTRGPTSAPTQDAGTSDTASDDDSDCAVSTPGAGRSTHGGAALALLGGLAVLLGRRRRQR